MWNEWDDIGKGERTERRITYSIRHPRFVYLNDSLMETKRLIVDLKRHVNKGKASKLIHLVERRHKRRYEALEAYKRQTNYYSL